MDNPSYLNDILLMLSALGSAAAGVMCGWQLRTSSLPKNAGLGADGSSVGVLDGAPLPISISPLAESADDEQTTKFKSVLFGNDDGGDDVLNDEDDPFASLYEEHPKGLSPSDIHEVAERLVQMADRITADVDAHDAQLSAVNHSLASDGGVHTVESVMASVERLIRANETMQAQLRESRDRIFEQARQIESAESRANTDALTKVCNRRAFDRELAAWTGETPGVLALLDIDHFKKFNDEHGHRAGDEVLRDVANTLRNSLEKVCLVARYGGEEFALVFTNYELDDVLDVIESARVAISQHVTKFEDKSFHVTCSLGVTRMLHGEPSAEWLQRADDGMYLSKDAGRNCGHCIDSQEIGSRQSPFRLGQQSAGGSRRQQAEPLSVDKVSGDKADANSDAPVTPQSPGRVSIDTLLERVPNCQSLGESYRELLQRLGKAPVKLSVIAISIDDPERIMVVANDAAPSTRFAQLLEVCQASVRPVDRVGYADGNTLLICMPGIDGDALEDRVEALRDDATTQLQLDVSQVFIGAANIAPGDNFERLVQRATHHATN